MGVVQSEYTCRSLDYRLLGICLLRYIYMHFIPYIYVGVFFVAHAQ